MTIRCCVVELSLCFAMKKNQFLISTDALLYVQPRVEWIEGRWTSLAAYGWILPWLLLYMLKREVSKWNENGYTQRSDEWLKDRISQCGVSRQITWFKRAFTNQVKRVQFLDWILLAVCSQYSFQKRKRIIQFVSEEQFSLSCSRGSGQRWGKHFTSVYHQVVVRIDCWLNGVLGLIRVWLAFKGMTDLSIDLQELHKTPNLSKLYSSVFPAMMTATVMIRTIRFFIVDNEIFNYIAV